MKTFEQYFHDSGTGGYPLRTILENLTDEEIEDSVKEFAKEYSRSLCKELTSVAYQANNHARRMANKPHYMHGNLKEVDLGHIEERAEWLAENFGSNDEPKIVQS